MPDPSRPAPDSETRLLKTAQERGILSADQLDEALRTRRTLGETGVARAIEDVLFEKGVFTPEQVRAFRQLARETVQASDVTALAGWERTTPGTRGGAVSAQPDTVAGEPFGRYRLMEPLGRGGMGVVWKAWDTDLRRVVALKQILGGDEVRGQTIDRFLREARAAARLRHPNIVPVYDVGVIDGKHYLTADFVDGTSLDRRMREEMSTRDAVALVKTVAEALQYAHDQGVVHRDIKPGNILVDRQGVPHVADFGLAKDASPGSGPALTVSGDVLGTPSYMSPEQARGRPDEQGPASDQFSLGVMLYEMVTGNLPFVGTSLQDILNAITDSEPVAPTRHSKNLHADVETVILKTLEKDPARRYPSMRALAADLGRILDSEPIEARRPGLVSRIARRAAKHKGVSVAVVLVGLVGAGLGLYALSARSGEQEALAAMRKARLVQDVFGRWAAVSDTVRELEIAFYDETIDMAETKARSEGAWKRIERFAAETPSDPTSQATMKALVGWARRLAGDTEASRLLFEESRRLDPDLPYGALFQGVIALFEYGYLEPLPPLDHPRLLKAPGRARPEPDAQRARRERAKDLLAEAEGAAVWGEETAQAARHLQTAIDAYEAGRFAEADVELTAAMGTAELLAFRVEFIVVRSKVRYLARQYAPSLEDMAWLAGACPGYLSLRFHRGDVFTSMALDAEGRGEDGTEDYRRAIEEYTAAIEGRAEVAADALHARALARWLLSEAADAKGAEGLLELDRAIQDLTTSLEQSPGDAFTLRFRGIVHVARGDALGGAGAEARAEYDAAVADLGACLGQEPLDDEAHHARGEAHLGIALCEVVEGRDPRPSFHRAYAEFKASVKLNPGDARHWTDLGLARLRDGMEDTVRDEDPTEDFRAALDAFGSALARDAASAPALGNRGLAHFGLGSWLERSGRDARAEYRAAAEDLRTRLSGGPSDAELHTHLSVSLYRMGDLDASTGGDPRAAWGEAIVEARKALDEGAVSKRLHSVLADLLSQEGKLAEAVQAGRTAVEKSPSNQVLQKILRYLEDLQARSGEAGGTDWRLLAWLSDEAFARDEYARGRLLAEDAIAAAPEAALSEEAQRRVILTCHYNAACAFARLLDPSSAPWDLGDAVRSQRRDAAFAHLVRAVELGWSDAEALQGDEDLAPLRDDPRWRGLLDSLPRK